MVKTKKGIISILMAIVMLVALCVPAMAAKPAAVTFENGITVTELQELINDRALGAVGINAVRVYPANLSTNQYYTSSYSYAYGGTNQICNLTINTATKNSFDANKCNGWYVEIDAKTTGATRFVGMLDNVTIGSGPLNGTNAATFSFAMPDFTSYCNWKVTLYDNSSSGIPLWGHIYR